MIKKDSVIRGFIIGILLPALFFVILFFLNQRFIRPQFKEPTIFFFCTCLNVLPFQYFLLKRKEQLTGKGILVSTFIYAIIYITRYLD